MPFVSLILSLGKWEAARDLNPCSAVSLTEDSSGLSYLLRPLVVHLRTLCGLLTYGPELSR